MRRPQGPQGEETAEEAPAEAEDQGPPDHVAPSPRQSSRHVRGQTRAANVVQWRSQFIHKGQIWIFRNSISVI